ncbi:MAG: T9SS type A sorting domain-containing protein [Candidatus Poribacteria bacterium]|nr:T9SS type A sorting domain-containing protein [Candidatus Poribacteria bacterium]
MGVGLAGYLTFWLVVAVTTLNALPEFWTSETPLSLGPARSNEPAICVRGPELFVIWSDNRLGRWELFFRYSRDGGMTWQPEMRLTTTRTDSVQPAIACDRRRVHIVWQERSTTQSQIGYKSWDGVAWSSTQMLSAPDDSARRPRIATTKIFPGGLVYVVWEGQPSIAQTNRPTTTAYMTRSSDGGRIWRTPQPVTSGNWDTSEPDVAGGVRAAYIAWRDGREATSQIYLKRWDEAAVSENFRLAAIGNCRRPSIAAFDPKVLVAWECSQSETAAVNIFAAESRDQAETWGLAQQISANSAESVIPRPVVWRDDAWIFWQDGASRNWQVNVAQRLQGGWTPAIQFTDRGNAIFPTPATRASTKADEPIHLVWVELTDATRSTIFYTQRDTIPPERPGQPVHVDFDAPLGFDNDSRLTFSWESPAALPQGTLRYHVFASVDGGDFAEIATTSDTAFEFDSENNKSYRVVVEAADAVGNRSASSQPSAPVFVDRAPPNVDIHLPNPNTVLTHPIPVVATCIDTNLVECRLQFGATPTPGTWTSLGNPIRTSFERESLIVWDTSELDGIYTLALIAIDEAGNRATTEIPLIIDNTPPLPIAIATQASLLITENLEVSYRTPVWSPDGHKIAFSSNEGGAKDIWMLDLRDNTRQRLTLDAAIDLNPAWHPEADLLVFQSQRNGQWGLWTVRSDGTNLRPLMTASEASVARTASVNFVTPAWSPAGGQIALAADIDGDLELWIVRNADDVLELEAPPELLQLTRNTAQDVSPTWAPDGIQLSFQSDRTGNWELWQINIDGSAEQRVYQNFGNETRPRWSPDGKSLLFLSDQPGRVQSAFVLQPQAESLPNQIIPTGIPIDSADWSPDGREIVYQSRDQLFRLALDFPAPAVEAVMTRPYMGEQLRGKVDIFGLARGTRFREYRLEWSEASSAPVWHQIGGRSTAPVTQAGFLGQWDTRRLRGEYLIRLVVLSTDGDEIEDEIRISVENEYPRLELFDPPDGLLTSETQITVHGRTEKQNTVVLRFNQASMPLSVDKSGDFLVQLSLNEGPNRIEVQAKNAIGLETSAHRTVIRDSQPPQIALDSPQDFAIFEVPYVTVSGQVDDPDAQLSINDTVIPLTAKGHFERTLLLKTGDAIGDPQNPDTGGEVTNLIRVVAIDRLGRETEEVRRVIYEKKELPLRGDLNPPAITEVLPPDGAVVTESGVTITAILIDDVAIDPRTIRFSFDEETFVFDGTANAANFDGKTFDFIPDTGQFMYHTPSIGLLDGPHHFSLEVQDTAGNSPFLFSTDSLEGIERRLEEESIPADLRQAFEVNDISLSQDATVSIEDRGSKWLIASDEATYTVRKDGAKLDIHGPVNFTFFIDTQPLDAAISAERVVDMLNVILATHKKLKAIPSVEILPSDSSLGYTINLNRLSEFLFSMELVFQSDLAIGNLSEPLRQAFEENGIALSQDTTISIQERGRRWLINANEQQYTVRKVEAQLNVYFIREGLTEIDAARGPQPNTAFCYEGQLPISPSQSGFTLSAIARPVTGDQILVVGYFTDQDRFSEVPLVPFSQFTDGAALLFVDGGPAVMFPEGSPTPQATLRSQGGLDQNTIIAQRQNAVDREMNLRQPVYVIEFSTFAPELPFWIALPLPQDARGIAMFQWDNRFQRWQPLDARANSFGMLEAFANQPGSYALLVDLTPPIIHTISPKDQEEVPLDRFLIEHEITDEGAGVDTIQLWVDDRSVEFLYDRETGHLTYLPGDLDPGRHTLEIRATDRAGNEARGTMVFFTRDIFAFADKVVAYPNPASQDVTITFKLTKSADVELEIYDVVGQLVYTDTLHHVIGQQSASQNEAFTWKCENPFGEPVASGVYIYSLEAKWEGRTVRRTGKVAVVR